MINNYDKEKEKRIKESKKVCCDICETRDFGMIPKIKLALVIYNLVVDFHKKMDEINSLKEQIIKLNKGEL